MTEEECFIEQIIAQPAEDSVRLIYADWLQENGQEERAEFIRIQCELRDLTAWQLSSAIGTVSAVPNLERVKQGLEFVQLAQTQAAVKVFREQELFHKFGISWLGSAIEIVHGVETDTDSREYTVVHGTSPFDGLMVSYRYSRGFIGGVRCGWVHWCNQWEDLTLVFPIDRVELLSDVEVLTSAVSEKFNSNWHSYYKLACCESEIPGAIFTRQSLGYGDYPDFLHDVRVMPEDIALTMCEKFWKGITFKRSREPIEEEPEQDEKTIGGLPEDLIGTPSDLGH